MKLTRIPLAALTTLIPLPLGACAAAPGPVTDRPPVASSGGTAQSKARADVLAQDPQIRRVVDVLRQRGFTLNALDLSAVELLSDAPGVAYRLGESQEWVHLHRYGTAGAAMAAATRLSTKQPTVIIDWVARPHFFRCDRTIVMYAGARPGVLSLLASLCGVELAANV